MPGRSTNIRFSEDLWEVLEHEAARQGTSVAQVVRDAVLLRLGALEAVRPEAPPDVPALPEPDRRRVESLRRIGGVEAGANPSFDRLARIAAQVLNAPVALVSLVTEEEHLFESCVGLPREWADRGHLPITHSFCVHTVREQRPLIVGDTREHPLLAGNPAIGELEAIAYAGVPLITGDGAVVGTLCVVDREPRIWTRDQVGLLSDLAAAIVTELEARADSD
jgi:signal transduction protein with GAF and PtsI domain